MSKTFAAISCLVIPSLLSGIAVAPITRGQIAKMFGRTISFSLSQAVLPKATDVPDWEIAAGGTMQFDVASIKRDNSDLSNFRASGNVPLGPGDAFRPTGGLFSARNVQLGLLISFAYKISPLQRQAIESQLPRWAVANHYDVEARAKGNPTKDQFRLMAQALLADRFELAIHFETRQAPVFALVLSKAGKLGPNLRRHVDEPPCSSASNVNSPDVQIATITGGYPLLCHIVLDVPPQKPGFKIAEGARDVTIQSLATALTIPALTRLDRPLIDKTGLDGTFDFFIEWRGQESINPSAEMQAIPTFEEALNEQLGLRPELASAPTESIVIDHIEQPSPN